MWKPLLGEIMKLYVNPVGMVTTYTEHTRSRNMEPTFIGNHESIGSERLPFLLTTSGLQKMITTN